ncbi:MAG: LamG-like jellyroll fold domain-containing protein [Candidatus Diapherotrites archaeon]|nr:LamG-like jellyroll fold domain-containing protein [Candidatus Diapherotrites archaeon]
MNKSRKFIGVALAFFTILLAQLVLAIPEPAALWKFDESSGSTAFDTKGAYNGTLAGNASFVAGKFGNAASFDGTNSYITVGTGKFGITTEFSMAYWIFLKGSTGTSQAIIARSAFTRPFVANLESNLRQRFGVRTSTTSYLTATSAIPLSQWVHVALTFKSGERIVYINGQPITTDAWIGSLNWVSDNEITVIGMNPGSPYSNPLNANLDDLRVYNTALSAAEVQELYSGIVQPPTCTLPQILCGANCITPACTSSAQCNDSNPNTTDTCNNAGTCTANCTHTPITPPSTVYVGGAEVNTEYDTYVTPQCLSILNTKRILMAGKSNQHYMFIGTRRFDSGMAIDEGPQNVPGLTNYGYEPYNGENIPANIFSGISGQKTVYYSVIDSSNRYAEFNAFFRNIPFSGNGYTYTYNFSDDGVDAAMMDPRLWSTPEILYSSYTSTFDALQADFPAIKFIYFTHIYYGNDQTLQGIPEAYNNMIYQNKLGQVPIFDWGDIVSTQQSIGGTTCTRQLNNPLAAWNNSACVCKYTDGYRHGCSGYDGTHYSDPAMEDRMGKAYLLMLAKLFCTAPPANNPPILSAIGNKTVTAGQQLQFTVSATDPESNPLTYSASNLPSGATFNSSTRAFSWTPTTTQAGTYSNVNFSVSDGQASDSEAITITVNSETPPTGEQIFISQSGTGTGASCSSPRNAAWFNTAANWGTGAGKISAGDTVHLCGAINFQPLQGGLRIYGSGTAGNPITVYFEPNAKLSAPVFGGDYGDSSGGAIDTRNNNYLIIDGGTNGIIESTDTGMVGYFTYYRQSSTNYNIPANIGVAIGYSNNVEVKNLNINNLFQSIGTEPCGCGYTDRMGAVGKNTGAAAFRFSNATNIKIHHNTVTMAGIGIGAGIYGNANIEIYNNVFRKIGAATHIGVSGATAEKTLDIHDNRIEDTTDWGYNDGLKIFGDMIPFSGIKIHNNTIGPNMSRTGHPSTAWVLISDGWFTAPEIYNNIFLVGPEDGLTSGMTYILNLTAYHDTAGDHGYAMNSKVYNNTVISENTNASYGITFAAFSTASSGHRVYNNVFKTKGMMGTYLFNNGATMEESGNNVFYSAAGLLRSDLRYVGPTDRILTAEPALGTDYRPTAGSSLINAGRNLGAGYYNFDYAGTNRNSYAPWDIGAFEYYSGQPPICTPSWSCTAWSPTACPQSQTQTRTCTDSQDCGTTSGKPAETQTCIYIPPITCFDLTGDSKVDVFDLVFVSLRLGNPASDPADVFGNDGVNIQDLQAVAGQLGQNC